MTAVISNIQALPTSPYSFLSTGKVAIVIASGVPSYFKVSGANLQDVVSVAWYPKNPSSLSFTTRELILLDSTVGTFMIRVMDNYLDATDRSGHISFRLVDGSNLTFPVVTYGPVSVGPLWSAPDVGLITG